MSNPRIEEVDSDVSDPEEVDLEDAFDFARPGQSALAPAMEPSQGRMDPAMLQQFLGGHMGQQGAGQGMPQVNEKERLRREQEAKEKTKMYQCLYPVYFDVSRSREEGRRVSKEDAVSNPLAREIVEALQYIGSAQNIPFQVVFEPSKSHPKDWANPGRVRVLVKQNGKAISTKVSNSKL
jgi:signal recognition particle subunit SRP19